jgi:hypothetical protein
VAKFTAGQIEPLDYDFTPAKKANGKGKCSGKGTIPEPSREDIDKYLARINALQQANGTPGAAPTENQWPELMEAVTELTNGKPSREELEELPFREFLFFIRWLGQEFTNPEGLSAATRS